MNTPIIDEFIKGYNEYIDENYEDKIVISEGCNILDNVREFLEFQFEKNKEEIREIANSIMILRIRYGIDLIPKPKD